MSYAQRMAQMNPSTPGFDLAALLACIDRAQACTACADACLGEQGTQMLARCIRLALDCPDLCDATGKISSRQPVTNPTMPRAARQECKPCGDECGQRGRQHCAACAGACRRCEQACNALLQRLAA